MSPSPPSPETAKWESQRQRRKVQRSAERKFRSMSNESNESNAIHRSLEIVFLKISKNRDPRILVLWSWSFASTVCLVHVFDSNLGRVRRLGSLGWIDGSPKVEAWRVGKDESKYIV